MQVQSHTIHWQVCSPVFWVSLTIFFSIMLWLIITWVFKAVVLTNAFKKKVYLLIGITFKKDFMDPFLWMGFEEAVYFLPLSFQKFLVLILLTSEGWKAELTLELPNGFEHRTHLSQLIKFYYCTYLDFYQTEKSCCPAKPWDKMMAFYDYHCPVLKK